MSHIRNVLVTGGLGFIGSWYVKLLARSEYYPIIIDKHTYAADVNRIKGAEDDVCIGNGLYIGNRLHIGDICDDKLVTKIVKDHNIDIIVNFAAETHVDRSIIDSKQFIYSNVVGVQNLLEIIRKNKESRNDIKFIQVSTDEVYGSIEEGSFKETDRLNPRNPYSACKAGADLLCLSYYNTYGIDVCITRSSNNYGPWQYEEKFVPRMINLAMKNKPLEIYGNGKNVRDWLYVEDNCEGIKTIMENGKKGEIYNIGAGNEFDNNQIAKIISDRFGVEIKYIEDRLGHDKRYSINFRKIYEQFGWKPNMNFYDGLNKTIDWHITNQK